jgi:hypothetical protein
MSKFKRSILEPQELIGKKFTSIKYGKTDWVKTIDVVLFKLDKVTGRDLKFKCVVKQNDKIDAFGHPHDIYYDLRDIVILE